MAEILPECLIHKILCNLSFKEATKMTILSKTWLQACLTLPKLKFTVDYRNDNMKIVDHIMERYRDGKIPIEKFELSNSSFSSELFRPLIDKWLYIALQNGVKDLVFGGFGLKLPIFKILAAKSLRELVLSDCSFKFVSFTKSNSLRKLSLTRIDLDENMLQTILDSCPSIVTLILMYCSGLKKIELLSIEHLSYCGSGEELDVVECRNLKSLDISYVRISNGFLRDFISRYQSLNVLKIEYCKGVREIDSSNLVSLVYEGYEIPELKNAGVSSQLKNSKIVFECCNLSAEWFCKLRKFLSNSTSWSQISLSFSAGCNEINTKDLQLHHGVATPHVDVLDVHIPWQNWASPTFVDALLWSCQPRRLNAQLKREMLTCFIERLMYIKNLRHSPLKEAKVYRFGKKNQDWHRVEFKHGKLSMRTIRECEKYLFLLDW